MKNHMPASGRFLRPINRRLLLKAAAAFTGVAAAGRVPAALAAMFEDVKDQYLNAGVDWRQAEGRQVASMRCSWLSRNCRLRGIPRRTWCWLAMVSSPSLIGWQRQRTAVSSRCCSPADHSAIMNRLPPATNMA